MDTVSTAVVEHLIHRLEQLVRIETPSGDVNALARFADSYGASLLDSGAAVRLESTDLGPHMIATWAGRGRFKDSSPILLLGHSDTVWPVGTLDGPVPWRRVDRIVAGPGTYDMKAGLALIEIVMSRDFDRPPVKLFVAADEEVGSPSSSDLLQDEAAECAMAIGFESPHPDGALKVGRMGSTRLRIEVEGRASHAALEPDAGESAADELVDQLNALRAQVEDLSTAEPGRILRNVGAIEAPGRTNVVNARATAEVGLRFRDEDVERATLERLLALKPGVTACTIRTHILSSRPTWLASDQDRQLVAHLKTLDPTIESRPAAGAADTNGLGRMELAVVDGFGPMGAGAHAVNEHVDVVSLMQRAGLLEALLREPPDLIAPSCGV